MKIKLKDKKHTINPLLGLCFNRGGYDEKLIDDINSGKEVEASFIPPNADELVKVVKPKTKKGAK
jgi:hypothetical protein|tara:strand:+ start:2132 stop:2326 length:195 start_codon:yes stop_codon:yes gene_type:complete